MTSALIGALVQLRISDPWEFVTEVQKNSIDAVIEQVSVRIDAKTDKYSERESILIRIMKPFAYKTRKFEFLLSSPRHFGKGLRELMNGGDISFNFLRIPELTAKSDDPFRADDDWRGGPEGFIGSVQMASTKNGRL
jgi:hypothetical protein